MRILLVAHKVPYPLHDGYNLHNYNYSRRIGSRHELDLFSLGAADELAPDVAAHFRQTFCAPEREPPRRGVAARIAGVLSADELYDFDPRVAVELEQTVAAGDYDLVWVSGARMLLYSARLRGVPVLADIADDGVRHERSLLRRCRTPRQFLSRLRRTIKVHRFQRKYLAHAVACNVVTEPDRASLASQLGEVDISVIHNGVDSETFRPLGTPPDHPSLVFEGSMDFDPNVEGALHLCEQVLPLVKARVPEVRVTLVGRNPTAAVRALAGPGIEVTGLVDDVRPHLDRASVFVCPLLSGSGIKNKILQAWSMEKAVVATPGSCAGLWAADGENLIVASEPQEFANAVVRLLGDPELRGRLGAAGRRTVEANYSWSAKAAELEAVMLRAAGRRGESVFQRSA